MIRAYVAALLLCVASATPAAAEEVSVASLGIHVTKPEGWQTLTAEANLDNLRRATPEGSELQALMLRYATAPVIAFTKYAEPYDDLNPSFKLTLKPMGKFAGQSATAVLAAILPGIKAIMPDVVVEQAPTETRVSGLPAAYLRVHTTIKAVGREFPTTSEMWIVPRGSYFFMLGVGTRQDEATGTRAEVRAIVDSIRIDPVP